MWSPAPAGALLATMLLCAPGAGPRNACAQSAGVPAGQEAVAGSPGAADTTEPLRRRPAARHVPIVRKGDLLVGYGVAYSEGFSNPLSGLSGNLLSPAVLTVSYGIADMVQLEVTGAFHVLDVQVAGPPLVDLDPGADSGTTSDFGDIHVATRFVLLGSERGASGGLSVDVRLPSSDEGKGIGTNSTDVRLGVLGGLGAGPWRLDADVGVVILEAPAESFEQNDQFAYAAELLYRPGVWPLRLALGVNGRANTRGRVPLGTEDRGEASLSADWLIGRLVLDAGLSRGYGAAPDWTLHVGASCTFRL